MITVHVGLHKTGSTSIQSALRLAGHRGKLRVFAPWPRGAFMDPRQMTSVFGAARTKQVVISDERILGELENAYSDARRRVADMSAALAGVNYQIVMFVRPQVDWLPSAYLQLVQQGSPITLEQFWPGIRSEPYLRWARLVELLETESGASRVIVRAYLPGRDVVQDFFTQLGLGKPPRPTSLGIRENPSITALQAPIVSRLLGDTSLTDSERSRVRHLFQYRLSVNGAGGEEYSPFPPEIQQEIVARLELDWSALAAAVEHSDPGEAALIRESQARWERKSLPYPGNSLSDLLVAEELIRCLGVLALESNEPPSRALLKRLKAKVRGNPADLPAAAIRAARGAMR